MPDTDLTYRWPGDPQGVWAGNGLRLANSRRKQGWNIQKSQQRGKKKAVEKAEEEMHFAGDGRENQEAWRQQAQPNRK